MRRLTSFLRGLVPRGSHRRQVLEADIADELRFHLEMRTRDNVAAGMAPDEARFEALRRFGSPDRIKAQCLQEHDARPARNVLEDARAVGILGFGLGLAGLLFLLSQAVLVRPPLTYHDGNDWVAVWWEHAENRTRSPGSTLQQFLSWRTQSRAFEHLTLARYRRCVVADEAAEAYVTGKFVSARYFDHHGVAPLLGRVFRPNEEEFNARPVVVLSHAYWQDRYGGDPEVIGRSIRIDARPYTVVGVMPPRFRMYHETAFFAPLTFDRGDRSREYLVAGQLKRGYTIAQAEAELHGRVRTVALRGDDPGDRWHLWLRPVQQVYSDPVRHRLYVLLGIGGLLMLVIWVHLFRQRLTRSCAGLHDAGGTRRQVLVDAAEGVMTAVLGGVLGLWLVAQGLDVLGPSLLGSHARRFDLSLDGRVVGFILSLALLVGLFLGVAPAILRPRRLVWGAAGAAPVVSGQPVSRLSKVLLACEVSLALVLLLAAGLAMHGMIHLERVDPGFDTEGVVMLRVDLPTTRYPTAREQVRFYGEAFREIDTMPGVRAASLAGSFPLDGDYWTAAVTVADRPGVGEAPSAYCNFVGRDYLGVMGIPVRRGRSFVPEDYRQPHGAVVVNETAAARLWPGQDPVGRTLYLNGRSRPFQVIGVAGDVRQDGLHRRPQPQLYLLYWQAGGPDMNIVVRADGDPGLVAAKVQAVLQGLDPNLTLAAPVTAAQIRDRSLGERRWLAGMLALLAAVALVLALTGLYRTVADAVRTQTREIGIRKLLGATPFDILALVLRTGVRPVSAGMFGGLALAAGLSRILADWLPGAGPTADPTTYLVVPVVFAVVALVAGYIPARKATRVDPRRILRAV